MTEKTKTPSGDERPIEIDYDHVDVASIMDQIKGKIASRERPLSGDVLPLGPAGPLPPAEPVREPSGIKAGLKKILLKFMRPFAPLIKLLVFPIHQELRRTIVTLDQTNRRLDSLFAIVQKELPELRDALNRRLDSELPPLREDIVRLKEYTKLLHNLSHGLVVEMTKLKIEEETLKNKVRIMEKDFEFLGKRERALEEEALK